MPTIAKLASLWRTLTRGSRLDRDLDEELRSYLAEIEDRKIAAGMTPDAAKRAAIAEVGGVEQVKEQVRDVRVGQTADETLRDVSYAWRMLRKSPGFAFAAIATLALGVGATTAIFSVVDSLLIEPLPYRDASRLVFVWADQSAEGYPRAPLSGPELKDLDTKTTRFDGFAAIWSTTAALTDDGDPEQLRIGLVSTDFFSLLGAEAGLGRTFEDGDDAEGPPTSIVLSPTVWQRRYGSDPSIVGKRIEVNGQQVTVIGVMPVGFRLLLPPDSAVQDDLDAWVPFGRRFTEGARGQRYLRVIGRMRAGVSLSEAADDIAKVGREISREFTTYGSAGRQFETIPLHADSTRELRGPVLALFAGVGILLLIACVNVSSLLIARAAARTSETALRVALGARPGRLVRQHLVEGLLLTSIGVLFGLIVARWGLASLVAVAPDTLSRMATARIDITVIVFSSVVMLLWGSLLSLAPLVVVFSLKMRFRSALIVGQIALSVMLVVGAALLVRTAVNLNAVDAGFRADNVLSFRVALFSPRYETTESFNAFSRRLQSELAAIPGVTGVAAISHAPYDHVPNWGGPYISQKGADIGTAPQADYRALTPGLIDRLSIRLIEGRDFAETDEATSQPVVIVDERLANRTWPGRSAVGQRIGVDPFVNGNPSIWATVIGVVKHVRHRALAEEVRDQVYFAQRQVQRNPFVFVVGTSDPAGTVPPVRAAVARLDPALPIYDVRPLADYVTDASATRRFTALMASIFAGAALFLACIGIYGVVAYSVAQRKREFGVRLALGASPAQVIRLVIGEGSRLALLGILIGVAITAVTAALLRAQLFGVSPWDPLSYLAALPALALAALAASAFPARRAASATTMNALRTD